MTTIRNLGLSLKYVYKEKIRMIELVKTHEKETTEELTVARIIQFLEHLSPLSNVAGIQYMNHNSMSVLIDII
jgi:hypothetical protein